MVDSTTTIKRYVHARLNIAVDFVAPSLHVEGSNRRMMAYLLEENWATIQPTLIGLA